MKIKKSEKDWLLIKERDAWMTAPGEADAFPEESVLSGLTVDEVMVGRASGWPDREGTGGGGEGGARARRCEFGRCDALRN